MPSLKSLNSARNIVTAGKALGSSLNKENIEKRNKSMNAGKDSVLS